MHQSKCKLFTWEAPTCPELKEPMLSFIPHVTNPNPNPQPGTRPEVQYMISSSSFWFLSHSSRKRMQECESMLLPQQLIIGSLIGSYLEFLNWPTENWSIVWESLLIIQAGGSDKHDSFHFHVLCYTFRVQFLCKYILNQNYMVCLLWTKYPPCLSQMEGKLLSCPNYICVFWRVCVCVSDLLEWTLGVWAYRGWGGGRGLGTPLS